MCHPYERLRDQLAELDQLNQFLESANLLLCITTTLYNKVQII